MENIIETKDCRHCGVSFDITDKDLEFLDRLSPSIAGQKIEFPTPTMCPECRKIHLLAWRNERTLYKRKCDATGKYIISHFPPDTPFKVYEEKIWNSDYWDAKEHGQDFDFSRTFSEQFAELQKNIPLPATAKSPPMENADYCNNCGSLKDSYLCFNAQDTENCYYCIDTWYSSDCVDCYCTYNSKLCHECTIAYDSYNVRYAYDIRNCRDGAFLLSCEGCQNCYGCFGLTNQQYHIYNTPYSPEEYAIEVEKLSTLPLGEQKAKFEAFYTGKYIKSPLPNTGSENVEQSSNIIESKNVFGSRNLQDVEDIRYASILHETKLAMDYYVWGHNAERIYSCNQIGNNVHSIYFSSSCWDNVHDLFYSFYCLNGTHDCFGCIGLRNHESYCILNKQYTREEYEKLVPQIIEHMRCETSTLGVRETGEWGEPFPPKLSSFGYNESVAHIFRPLTRDDAIEEGFRWSDYETPFPKVEKIIPAAKLPEDISKIPDDILNWAIECEVTGKPFRIIKQELEFYRKHNLPIPRQHPEQRHLERLKWHINY
ncbi:MAG: hypothetical protein Q8K26_01325 [Candidatus Gracilibacteria bacterium]|nr:hypothetical protein [Candidatus Gracilibacteria bacterium]